MPADIVLSLPAPLSVNRTRKIDWANHKKVLAWKREAYGCFLMQKQKLPPAILGRYEIIITLRDGSKIDADNTVKLLCDTVRLFGLVTDDDPKHMRRIAIEFGQVDGCRVTIRAVE